MKQGFTLIELMVVVLIIGILSAIALPQYTKAIAKARVAEALAMVDSMQKGVDMWVLENGYPNSSTELVGLSAGDHQAKQLLIDSENALNCTGDRCEGEYFTYDAYCYSSGCTANAESIDEAYGLVVEKEKSTRKWTKTCWYESDMGRVICEQLSGQGWAPRDDR